MQQDESRLNMHLEDGCDVTTRGTPWRPKEPLEMDGGARRNACRFCETASGSAPWDQVIVQTPNFRVLPSKGGFLPGWLMVVPRVHVLSMVALSRDTDEELRDLVRTVSDLLAPLYGPPTLFEHGAVEAGTSFGCGIDHAHLHLVPLPAGIDLLVEAEAALGSPFTEGIASSECGYLRVCPPGGDRWFVATPKSPPPRQFFRRVLWRSCGRPVGRTYDYDEEPCEAVVRSTVERLGMS